MKPAAFLDRDGTIIELVHHLTEPKDVKLIHGAAKAIKDLKAAGYEIIVVTNQSVIGRGKTDDAGVAKVHDEMNRQLAEHDAAVDAIYLCPLAPTIKDPTVIEDNMRKPGPGMLQQAAREHSLDLENSYMVGDSVSDLLAGRHAGCKSILVQTGYGAKYAFDSNYYDYNAADLTEAAHFIFKRRNT